MLAAPGRSDSPPRDVIVAWGGVRGVGAAYARSLRLELEGSSRELMGVTPTAGPRVFQET